MTFTSVLLPLAVIATTHLAGADAPLLPAAVLLALFAALAAAYAPALIRAIARVLLPAPETVLASLRPEDEPLVPAVRVGVPGTARPRAPSRGFRAAR